MPNDPQHFLTQPRLTGLSNPRVKAALMALVPVVLVILIAFTAPGKMRELDLSSEQQTIGWLLIAALLISLMAWMVLIFAASRLAHQRAVTLSHALSGAVFCGGIWAVTRPNFNPTQLISAVMLIVAIGTLINVFGLALVLWQSLQQRLADANGQTPPAPPRSEA
jgi:ABC-type polysaccharide transport system permease subunit